MGEGGLLVPVDGQKQLGPLSCTVGSIGGIFPPPGSIFKACLQNTAGLSLTVKYMVRCVFGKRCSAYPSLGDSQGAQVGLLLKIFTDQHGTEPGHQI